MSFEIFKTKRFQKRFDALPVNVRQIAMIKVDAIIVNPFADSLDTHKLQGKLKEYWACSVNYKYRIIFSIQAKRLFLETIGSHSIYDRFR